MSYTKDTEFKLVRTKHIISIYEGARGQDVLDDMKHVPFEARLTSWETDGDELILTFFEEKTGQ